ncbi:putative heterokaryon incompatibility protein OR [Rosellinia necatrix]|uniref:Putative heterokaryon incompatibility protein OR n=1 Tax=Rosellinia necatrix TaxID=77044 RepID=A0A1S7UQZ6_ROSNE|nr:putative heterokaryon incompatibility protein OR [Rosellinia necatrix]
MAFTPRYLLCREDDKFFVFDTGGRTYEYDIVSYCWGAEVEEYDCKIDGVNWLVRISEKKIAQFKKLMRRQDVKCMWVDSLCINKSDKQHESEELSKMFQYYKQARNCYLLMDTPKAFNPEQIADDLKFLDHIQSNIGGASMISGSQMLAPGLRERHARWAEKETWIRDEMPKAMLKSAGIDLGVMNCYNTCANHVMSLFSNKYFTRVWTFQEMILGKNIEIIGVTRRKMSNIGSLHQWMELAYDCRDKASKLYTWINRPRNVSTVSIEYVLALIIDDLRTLKFRQTMVKGIEAARTDIINGGQYWWRANQKGVSNIFSAISITPRECGRMEDIFRGLLGIFSGLFSPQEIETIIVGDDLEKISLAFFQRLSTQTGLAWTRLAVSPRDRGEWDWIPVVDQKHDPNAEVGVEEGVVGETSEKTNEEDEEESEDQIEQQSGEETPEGAIKEEAIEKAEGGAAAASTGKGQRKKQMKQNLIKTDIYAGVTQLGVLRKNGRAEVVGVTGLLGKPRKLMSIHLKEENPQFHFVLRGCNGGKKLSNGFGKRSQTIPAHDDDARRRPVDVSGDETGRTLAECATILGCLLDPGSDVLAYRRRLLYELDPQWATTDPSARPDGWADRCVSGTVWAEPACPALLRTHNLSMNLRLGAISACESRLARGSTARVSCELRVNCGCVVTGPFALVFGALAAVQGSSLGCAVGARDGDDRITLRDGLGLVQIGDLGKTFDVVAFGGDPRFHRRHAALCRSTKNGKPVPFPDGGGGVPRGRALVRSDFTHGLQHLFRNYGCVDTGAGNLLICRSYPLASYRIRGVCVDGYIQEKPGRGQRDVIIK